MRAFLQCMITRLCALCKFCARRNFETEMWKLDGITSRMSDRIFIPIIAMHTTYTMNADRH